MKLKILENMPKKLKLFEGKEIRTLVNSETEEIWFVAKDVSNILEYARTNKMLERIDIEDKKTVPRNGASFIPVELFGNQGSLVIINDSGL